MAVGLTRSWLDSRRNLRVWHDAPEVALVRNGVVQQLIVGHADAEVVLSGIAFDLVETGVYLHDEVVFAGRERGAREDVGDHRVLLGARELVDLADQTVANDGCAFQKIRFQPFQGYVGLNHDQQLGLVWNIVLGKCLKAVRQVAKGSLHLPTDYHWIIELRIGDGIDELLAHLLADLDEEITDAAADRNLDTVRLASAEESLDSQADLFLDLGALVRGGSTGRNPSAPHANLIFTNLSGLSSGMRASTASSCAVPSWETRDCRLGSGGACSGKSTLPYPYLVYTISSIFTALQ
jgi:hypothetical protein